jgi:hypothetical protein
MSIAIEKILAASPTTSRGQSTQLSTDSKGERIAYAVCEHLQKDESMLTPSYSLENQYLFDRLTTPL